MHEIILYTIIFAVFILIVVAFIHRDCLSKHFKSDLFRSDKNQETFVQSCKANIDALNSSNKQILASLNCDSEEAQGNPLKNPKARECANFYTLWNANANNAQVNCDLPKDNLFFMNKIQNYTKYYEMDPSFCTDKSKQYNKANYMFRKNCGKPTPEHQFGTFGSYLSDTCKAEYSDLANLHDDLMNTCQVGQGLDVGTAMPDFTPLDPTNSYTLQQEVTPTPTKIPVAVVQEEATPTPTKTPVAVVQEEATPTPTKAPVAVVSSSANNAYSIGTEINQGNVVTSDKMQQNNASCRTTRARDSDWLLSLPLFACQKVPSDCDRRYFSEFDEEYGILYRVNNGETNLPEPCSEIYRKVYGRNSGIRQPQ